MMRATPQMDLMAQQATVEVQGTFIPSIRDFQAVSDDAFACAGPPPHLPGASTPPPTVKGHSGLATERARGGRQLPTYTAHRSGFRTPPLRLS